MCGIVGVWNIEEPFDANNFDKMVDTLSHRGPDGRGVKSLDYGRLLLGHRRLSIIDLTAAGDQPMPNEDGLLWLTFNGEIYNYKELKAELQECGHQFRSRSDSETVIHAYEEWGQNCVLHLRGIFAFAVFDTKNRKLFLARDHIGVKPLYYHQGIKGFIFSSQPRAILASEEFKKTINPQAFSLYLAYGNVPSDSCIYGGIKKLLPGHWLLLEDGNITIKRYWNLSYKSIIRDFKEAEYAVNSKIKEAVCAQSVSDVRIGTLLSGGVDSTIITSILAQGNRDLLSFTIGFDEEESDERKYASFVAKNLNTNHHEHILSFGSACQLIPQIVEAYDEPFHLNGLFPFFAVARLVQSEKVKVVLGGDGADELFAGYLWYEQFLNVQRSRSTFSNWMARFFSVKRNCTLAGPINDFFQYNGYFEYSEQKKLMGTSLMDVDPMKIHQVLARHLLPGESPVLSAQVLDFNCFLVDHCLTKVDRASMSCGVEVRVPFLDIELVELVFSIDHEIVFKNNERKALLKNAMKSYLPKGMDANRKKGFSSPLGVWINNGFANAGKKLLIDGSLCSHNLLDSNKLGLYYDRMDSSNKMLLISAELWCRWWVDNDTKNLYEFNSNLI